MRRRVANAILALAPGACFIGQVGCAGAKGPPEVTQAPYDGPPWTPSDRNALLTLVFECPTPGWRARFDQAREEARGSQVYVTLERPSPLFVYPQVIARQEVATPVPKARFQSEGVQVFVRVAESGQSEGDMAPYRISRPIGGGPPPAAPSPAAR